MQPAIVVFGDELGEADLARLLHLHNHAEQAAVVITVTCDNIGCTAQQMMAVCGSAHKGVELGAAIAAAHDDGLAPRLADRI